jgi:hypothetical protein
MRSGNTKKNTRDAVTKKEMLGASEGDQMGYTRQTAVYESEGRVLGADGDSTGNVCLFPQKIEAAEDGVPQQPQQLVKDLSGRERTCGVAQCGLPGRFGLHGRWACSRECLETMLRLIVVDERSSALAAEFGNGLRVQLGQILIEQGSITEAQLEQALRSQRATGAGRLGSWLKQQVDLSEMDFAAALAIQWHCPVFRLGNFSPVRMAAYLPLQLAEQSGALPLRLTGTSARLTICFEDHIDHALLKAVERMHGLPVNAGLLTASEFWEATRELLGARFPQCNVVSAPSIHHMTQAMSRVLVRCEAVDARLVAVHGVYWLRVWQPRASASATAGHFLENAPMPKTADYRELPHRDVTEADTAGANGLFQRSNERSTERSTENRAECSAEFDPSPYAAQSDPFDVLCAPQSSGGQDTDSLPWVERLTQQMLPADKKGEQLFE